MTTPAKKFNRGGGGYLPVVKHGPGGDLNQTACQRQRPGLPRHVPSTRSGVVVHCPGSMSGIESLRVNDRQSTAWPMCTTGLYAGDTEAMRTPGPGATGGVAGGSELETKRRSIWLTACNGRQRRTWYRTPGEGASNPWVARLLTAGTVLAVYPGNEVCLVGNS